MMSNITKTDRCAMSTPALPAASLRPHILLPARRALPWVASYLIYIVLCSIGEAIVRARPHFLPVLREGGRRWRTAAEPSASEKEPADELRASHQHRRPASDRETQIAEDHLRLHRGRGRGRARLGAQRSSVSQAPSAASLSRRRIEARPIGDVLRPYIL